MKRIRVTVDFWLDVPSYDLENLTAEAEIKLMYQNVTAPPIQIPAKLVHYQTQEIVEED